MKNSKHVGFYFVSSCLVLSLGLPGCGDDDEEADPVSTAVAEIQGLGTNTAVMGKLTFAQVDAGVMVTGTVSGLNPSSTHGIHLHEKGDCSAADGMSAGGHWNPTGQMHGGLSTAASHLGDLGNLVTDGSGNATVAITKAGAKLRDGSAVDVVGRGVIVHAMADDMMTDPSGNSGARIACGSIR
jgi:superoxide dismutase, Cu-Zn family